jgi:hypothetical protein
MAAGLGFKDFVTGEVLTAADVDGYLMQGIWVFASAAARDAAVTSPQEGNFAFTKDTNGLWYYDGAAWVASGATGDIEGVTAGVGISGGGTSGTVTVTNSMATAIDAKGDLIGGTGADTFARLAVGANDTVLTADSTTATGLKWAAPASGGGFTSLASGSLSGTSTVVSITTTGYKQLVVYVKDVTASADWFPLIRLNGDSGTNYTNVFTYMTSATALASDASNTDGFFVDQLEATVSDNFQVYTIYDPANADTYKTANFLVGGKHKGNTFNTLESGYGMWRNTAAITSITFTPLGGVTYSTGTYEIYGVK